MPKKKESLLGPGFRKVQPKLRMIANGSYAVNAVRADFSSAIRVGTEVRLESESPDQALAGCVNTVLDLFADRLHSLVHGSALRGLDLRPAATTSLFAARGLSGCHFQSAGLRPRGLSYKFRWP